MNPNCGSQCFCIKNVDASGNCYCGTGTDPQSNCWVSQSDFGLYLTELIFGLVFHIALSVATVSLLVITIKRMNKKSFNLKLFILVLILIGEIFRLIYYAVDPHHSTGYLGPSGGGIIYDLAIIFWLE